MNFVRSYIVEPVERLYIYEIEGDLERYTKKLKSDFLGCWKEAGHSYLFFSEPDNGLIGEILEENPAYRLISKTEMDYDQWEPADALKPFEVAPLSFRPAWIAGSNNSDMVIRMDPGVVFGAGTHHTTRKCLEFLVDLMRENSIQRVVDLGTGTGILALAAARLGAADVIAVDNNNLAVETAQKNSARNNLQDRIHCIYGDASEYLEYDADLTLANLIIWEIKRLFIPTVNYKSQWYIVSGLNRTDVHTFRQISADLPLKILHCPKD